MNTLALNKIPQTALPAIPPCSVNETRFVIAGATPFLTEPRNTAGAASASYFPATLHNPFLFFSSFCFGLYAFSFALTAKKFVSLTAREIFKTIMQKNNLDFKNEKTLCKEKFSALSNDFENVFIKKFLKRYNVFKNNFAEKFLENFEIAQTVFSQNISDETFCLRSGNLKCEKYPQEFLPRKNISAKKNSNAFRYFENASYDIGREAGADCNRCHYGPIPDNLKSLKFKEKVANVKMGTF